MPATATRLLTATEAQIRSGRSMVRFRQWVAAGRIPFTVDEHGRRVFDAADVDRLVAAVEGRELERRELEARRRDQEGFRKHPFSRGPDWSAAPNATQDEAPSAPEPVSEPPAPRGVSTEDVMRLLGLSRKEA
jgi:hypothetical protein